MWRTLKRNLPDVNKDDLLELLGLELRRTTTDKLVSSLAIFGAGVLLGAGLGLIFAPRSGSDLRSELRQRMSHCEEGDGLSESKG